MKGPNVEATAALAHAVRIPVIASGGVSSINDLQALKECGAPLEGAISGRALYDGEISIADATALLKAPRNWLHTHNNRNFYLGKKSVKSQLD